MFHKHILGAVVVLGLAGILAACGGTPAPEMTTVDIYFAHSEQTAGPDYVRPVERSLSEDANLPEAAVEELLQGPTAEEQAEGYGTAIPTPEEVQEYRERVVADGYPAPYEGDRVRLLSLEIEADGTAVADFSQEMIAYGGGSMRVMTIRQQIEQTLLQFPEIDNVVIAVEGETETVLQP